MKKKYGLLILLLVFILNSNSFIFFTKNLKKMDEIVSFDSWKLRISNNKKFIKNSSLIYFNLDDNVIKLNLVNKENIIATKTSNVGKIINLKPKKIQNLLNILNLNENYKEYEIKIKFYRENKYAYSILGIKIPYINYIHKPKYSIIKKLDVRIYDNILLIIDKKINKYYLFDSYTSNNKLPHIEISLNNLLLTQFIGFIMNFILIHLFNINN